MIPPSRKITGTSLHVSRRARPPTGVGSRDHPDVKRSTRSRAAISVSVLSRVEDSMLLRIGMIISGLRAGRGAGWPHALVKRERTRTHRVADPSRDRGLNN